MVFPRFRLLTTLTGHRAAVYAVVEGLDHESFLTAGGDGWIVRWNVHDPDPGRVVANVEGQVFALACHRPTGQYLAGTMQGDLHWFEDGNPNRYAGARHHPGGVYGVIATDSHVWTSGGDGRISMWDPNTRRPVHSIQIARKAVRRLSFHRETGLLAAATSDGGVCVLDASSLTIVRHIPNAHRLSAFTVSFSPDGKELWSGGRDALIKKWNLESQSEGDVIQGHWYTVNALVMDAAGGFLLSASRDRTIRVWDTATAELLQGLETVRDGGHRNSVNDLLWLPDLETLVSVSDDRTVSLWSRTPDAVT